MADEFDLDDLDFDDVDLSFDFEDSGEPSTKREAITKSIASAADGIKSSFISTQGAEDIITRAMPSGYAQAFSVKDAVVGGYDDIVRETAEDLKPITKGFKTGIKKILPKVETKLPDWFVKKLESLSESDESSYKQKDNSEELISNELAGIFQATAEKDQQQRSEEKAERLIRDRGEEKKFESTSEQLSTIGHGISRIVGYNEDVQTAVSKKSLEIQLKSFYLLKNFTSMIDARSLAQETALKEIVKNTGLPDALKIHKSELAGRMLSEKLVGGGIESIASFSSNYVGQLVKNVKGSIKGALSGAGDAGEMMEMVEMLEDMDPQQRNETIASMSGSMLGDELRMYFADKARHHIDKMDWAQKTSEFLKYNLTDYQSRFDTFAKSTTEQEGLLGQGIQALKDVMPKFYLKENLNTDTLTTGDKASYFDNTTHRSINQVIPSLLGSINRWVQITATGKWVDEEDTEVYNLSRGQMTTRSRATKDMSERIVDRNTRITVTDRVDSVIDAVVEDREDLSKEAIESLRRYFVESGLRNERFNAADLADSSNYDEKTASDVKDELSNYFRDRFNLEYDGTVIPGMEHEHKTLSTKGISALLDLKQALPTSHSTIKALVETYGVDSVNRTGFIRQAGNKNIINRAHLIDQLLAGEEDINEVDTTETTTSVVSLNPNAPTPVTPTAAPAAGVIGGSGELGDIRSILYSVKDIAGNIYRQLKKGSLPEEKQEQLSGSPLLDVLFTIRDNTDTRLTEILTHLRENPCGDFSGGDNARKGWGSKAMDAAGAVGGKVKDFAVGYKDLTLGFYKGLWKTAKGTAKLGADTAASTFNKVFDRTDIYVRGETKPRLYGVVMERGEYHDAETLEPIMSIDDIKGPVLDNEGNFILTQEDIDKGLHTSLGTSVLNNLMGMGKSLVKGYIGFVALPYKMAWEGAKVAKDWLKENINKINDVYIRGEKTPRLLARLLEEGNHYYDTVLKRYITDPKEIKGDILDAYGNIVLKYEDIQKGGGLFKRDGKSIFEGTTSFARGLFDKAMVPAKLYAGAVVGAYKFAKDIVVSAGGWIRGKFGITGLKGSLKLSGDFETDLLRVSHGQLSIQEKILEVLVQMRGDNEKDKHDRTGDGYRDGSWQADRYSDQAETSDGQNNVSGDNTGRRGPTWGGVAGAAKGAFNSAREKLANRRKEKQQREAAEGGLTTGNTVADAAIGTGAAAATWQAIRAGGAAAVRYSGIALREISKSAKTDRRVAIIAGIGIGAYYIWSNDPSKRKWLQELRLTQYGADYTNEEQVKVITDLERIMIPFIVRGTEGSRIDASKINMDALMSHFKLGPFSKYSGEGRADEMNRENELRSFLEYFTERFQPVLLGWDAALKELASNVKLHEIDEKFPLALGYELLDRVGNIQYKHLGVGLNPYVWGDFTAGRWAARTAMNRARWFFDDKLKESKGMTDINTLSDLKIAEARGEKLKSSQAEFNKKFDQNLAIKRSNENAVTMTFNSSTGKMERSVNIHSMYNGAQRGNVKQADDIRRFNPLRSTRYFTYGLDELNVTEFENLYRLETYCLTHVKFGGQVSFSGNANEALELMTPYFGHVGYWSGKADISSSSAKKWIDWFTQRFLPTFLKYCHEVRSISSTGILKADTSLNSDQKLKVAKEITDTVYSEDGAAVSVWEIKHNPWNGRSINTNRKSVDVFIAFLEKDIKEQTDLIKQPGPVVSVDGVSLKTDISSAAQAKSLSKPPITTTKVIDKRTGQEVKPKNLTMTAAERKEHDRVQDIKKFLITRAIRYYAYGLSELEISQFKKMSDFETYVLQYVTFGIKPTFKGDVDAILEATSGDFGISTGSVKEINRWKHWFENRFLPTFLLYCREASRRLNDRVFSHEHLLKVRDYQKFTGALANPRYDTGNGWRSVWEVDSSPWGHGEINTDRSTVDEFLKIVDMEMVKELDKQHYVVTTTTTAVNNNAIQLPNKKAKSSFSPAPQTTTPDVSRTKTYTAAPVANAYNDDLVYGQGGNMFTKPSGSNIAGVHGGSGGDFNQVPLSTGTGWESVKDTILAAADVVGFDPATAASIAGVESSYDPFVVNSIGAAGMFQIVPSTYKELFGKYANLYGIPQGTPATDHRANALLGIRYIKDNYTAMAKSKGNVSDIDVYMAHFLGPTGAGRFAKGADNDIATNHASAAAVRNNRPIFFNDDGSPKTVGGVKRGLDVKLNEWRMRHGLASSSLITEGDDKVRYSAPEPDVLDGFKEPDTVYAPPPTATVERVRTPRQQEQQSATTAAQDTGDVDHPQVEQETGNVNTQAEIDRMTISEQGEFTQPSGGDLADGSGAMDYIIKGDTKLDGLNPEFKKNLFGMIEEYGIATGKRVPINDAYRSYADQVAAKAKYGSRAATPGRSLHEYGLAADLNTITLNEMEKMGLMKKYGFTRPVGGETWHIEPSGIQSDIQGFKQNPQAAAAATRASLGRGGGGNGTVAGAKKYRRDSELAAKIFGGDGVVAGPSLTGGVQSQPRMPTPRDSQTRMPTGASVDTNDNSSLGNVATSNQIPETPKENENGSLAILEKQLSIQSSSHALFETMVSLLSNISGGLTHEDEAIIQQEEKVENQLYANSSKPMDTLPVSNVRKRRA